MTQRTHLIVDAANVVGARPDGWWKDRAAASTRFMTSLAELVGATIAAPSRDDAGLANAGSDLNPASPVDEWTLEEITVVLEGQAKAAPDVDFLTVVRAVGEGDDTLAELALVLPHAEVRVVMATSDKGLRARLPDHVDCVGSGWLRRTLDFYVDGN